MLNIFIKQYVYKQKYALIIFAIIVFISLFFVDNKNDNIESNTINIGFYIEDKNDEIIGEKLIEYKGIFKFLPYTDKKTLKDHILKGDLECGYIFKENFLNSILNGDIENKVTILNVNDSNIYKISYEVVFAQILDALSSDFLLKYLQDNFEGYNINELNENINKYFNYYIDNDETFKIQYETIDNKPLTADKNISPIREFIGLYIFIIALFGLTNAYENKFILRKINKKQKFIISQISIIIPIFMAILMGLILIFTFGIGENILKEIGYMLIYFIALVAFIEILYFLIPNKYMLYTSFPVFIILSLIICPIFIDFSLYLKPIKIIQMLLPLTYYLNLF